MVILLNALVENHTVAEINLSHFEHNIKAIRNKIPNSIMLAVIKTDAYGHGIVPIAKRAIETGVERLGVTTVEEGALLRENGIHIPIHILSPNTLDQAKNVVYYHLTPSVSSVDQAKALSKETVKQNKKIVVHVKVNTGLQRFGIETENAIDFFKQCYELPGIEWEGIYTHFSSADEGDWITTEKQFQLFLTTVKRLKREGYKFQLHHVGASTIALERKDMHLDMVRPGIALFGYQPDERQEKLVTLKPAMSLKTILIQTRTLPPKTSLGYGGNYVTRGRERIGIIPIGHGDGYKRRLSNNGKVLVRGRKADIVGTISLDQTFINLTAVSEAKEGDEIVLIGEQGNSSITARDVANWIHSNVDEVLASLMSRIKRIYVE